MASLLWSSVREPLYVVLAVVASLLHLALDSFPCLFAQGASPAYQFDLDGYAEW